MNLTVASTAIPAGVRCSACGRLHLPHRLHPLDSHDDPTHLSLCCNCCGAAGPLVLHAATTEGEGSAASEAFSRDLERDAGQQP